MTRIKTLSQIHFFRRLFQPKRSYPVDLFHDKACLTPCEYERLWDISTAPPLPYTKERIQRMDHQCWVLTKCGVHPRDQKIPLLGECCLWFSGVWLVVSSSSLLREEKEKNQAVKILTSWSKSYITSIAINTKCLLCFLCSLRTKRGSFEHCYSFIYFT